MKRVLVVGTSHSEATCQYEKNGTYERLKGNRWQDYFEEHDCEVTTIARAGTTVELQYMAVHAYFQEHPDITFDLAIIEGRSMETTISMPGTVETDKLVYSSFWKRYDTSLTVKEYEQREVLAVDSERIQDTPNFVPYYVEHVFSLNHAVNTWSTNYALCSLIATRAGVVKWFAFSNSAEFAENPNHRHMLLGKDILRDFIFSDELWPTIDFQSNKEDLCECKHLNERGHARFWKEKIYPNVKQYL